MARGYLPSGPGPDEAARDWVDGRLDLRVDDFGDACGGAWFGTFLALDRSGDAPYMYPNGDEGSDKCRNAGEIPMVAVHEFGHSLDMNDGGLDFPDGASKEAYADITAILETHERCVGDGFWETEVCEYGCHIFDNPECHGGRDVGIRGPDPSCDPDPVCVPVRPSNIEDDDQPANCDRWMCWEDSGGPMGYKAHCESLIASGAFWDMAKKLRIAHGEGAGWERATRIWFSSISTLGHAYLREDPLDIRWCFPDIAVTGCGGWYHAFLWADDDDGDPYDDLSPHGDLIWEAFAAHEIACGTTKPTPHTVCASLDAPVLTARRGTNQVRLYWTGVPGAGSYQVYRNVLGCERGFAPWGDPVDELSFVDTQVADGFPYYYAVQAVEPGNEMCRSPFSNCVQMKCPDVRLLDWQYSDVCGDGEDDLDQNETILLDVGVHNPSENGVDLPVEGWLHSADSDVTIVRSRAVFTPSPVSLGGDASARFVIKIGPDYPCDDLELYLELTTQSGCMRRFPFSVDPGGGCGALDDSDPSPGEVPDTSLRVKKPKSSPESIQLNWGVASGADWYDIYRGDFDELHTTGVYNHQRSVLLGAGRCGEPSLEYVDPDDGEVPGNFYYLVSGVTACLSEQLEGPSGFDSEGGERPAGGGCP
jgi:hypothetical protein